MCFDLEVKKLKEFKQKSVYAHNHRPYLDSQMYSSQSGHLEAASNGLAGHRG